MIIAMAGLPGSGKTTVCQELARRVNGAVLSKDQIRHALFAEQDIEYSDQQDDFCMWVMLETARYLVQKNSGRHVFLDGRTFSRRYQVERVTRFAEELNQPWRIVECVCSEETARRRLEAGDEEHPARNRDFELYQRVKARFEEITGEKTVVNTEQTLEACVKQGLKALR